MGRCSKEQRNRCCFSPPQNAAGRNGVVLPLPKNLNRDSSRIISYGPQSSLVLGLSMKHTLKRPASNPQSGTSESASNPSAVQPVMRSVADGPLVHFYLTWGHLITHHKSDFPGTLPTKLECSACAAEDEKRSSWAELPERN